MGYLFVDRPHLNVDSADFYLLPCHNGAALGARCLKTRDTSLMQFLIAALGTHTYILDGSCARSTADSARSVLAAPLAFASIAAASLALAAFLVYTHLFFLIIKNWSHLQTVADVFPPAP
jgi:hypothetical protein